jgi:hypothetical protein
MAYSYYNYTGDGSTTQFPVAFGYIRREHVLATVAGALASFAWVNSSTIQMDVAPANGATVRVYRVTPLSAPLVGFADGATLVAADLDTNATQSIYTQQELDDSLVEGLADVIPNGDKGDITTSVGGTVWTIDPGAITEAKVATGAITEAKVANGAVTTAKLASVIAPTVSSLNGGPIGGSRNAIINGNFDVWQRGTSTGTWIAPITNYYWADRWVVNSNGSGGAGSLSQQAFTVGQTAVPGEPTYFQRWQITAAATGQTTGNCWVEQRIEDVRTLAGQTATVSFYAQGTGTLPNIYLSQTFGTGGSAQVSYTLASNVALNASWTKYTYTVNLSSISGKTIGTNHYVNLTFMVPINATYTFDLAQVQLEPGTVATPFERRSIGQELALCQRYYEVGEATLYMIGMVGPYLRVLFKVDKRASPTVTRTGDGSISLSTAGSTVSTVNSIGFYFFKNGTTDATGGNYTASAEL